jgi:hypothetical protein
VRKLLQRQLAERVQRGPLGIKALLVSEVLLPRNLVGLSLGLPGVLDSDRDENHGGDGLNGAGMDVGPVSWHLDVRESTLVG